MFIIQTYVGPKFGNWLASNIHHPTDEAARRYMVNHNDAERHAGTTRMKRRVVEDVR